MENDVLNNDGITKKVKAISSLTFVRGLILVLSVLFCLTITIHLDADEVFPFFAYYVEAIALITSDFELHEIPYYLLLLLIAIFSIILFLKGLSLIVKSIKGLKNENYRQKLLNDKDKWRRKSTKGSPFIIFVLFTLFSLYMFKTISDDFLYADVVILTICIVNLIIKAIIKGKFKKLEKIKAN